MDFLSRYAKKLMHICQSEGMQPASTQEERRALSLLRCYVDAYHEVESKAPYPPFTVVNSSPKIWPFFLRAARLSLFCHAETADWTMAQFAPYLRRNKKQRTPYICQLGSMWACVCWQNYALEHHLNPAIMQPTTQTKKDMAQHVTAQLRYLDNCVAFARQAARAIPDQPVPTRASYLEMFFPAFDPEVLRHAGLWTAQMEQQAQAM